MSDDMRLLILTHLRAAMERKDWRQVGEAVRLAERNGGAYVAHRLKMAQRAQCWITVSAAYVAQGGLGAGAPTQSPGGTEKARDGVCGGVVA